MHKAVPTLDLVAHCRRVSDLIWLRPGHVDRVLDMANDNEAASHASA
jgi:hypothetical protein